MTMNNRLPRTLPGSVRRRPTIRRSSEAEGFWPDIRRQTRGPGRKFQPGPVERQRGQCPGRELASHLDEGRIVGRSVTVGEVYYERLKGRIVAHEHHRADLLRHSM